MRSSLLLWPVLAAAGHALRLAGTPRAPRPCMRLDLAAEGSLAADIARLGNRPAPPAPMSELGAALAFNLFVFVAKYVPGLAPLLLERGDWARVYGRIAAKEQARAGGTLPPQLTRWRAEVP